MTSSSLIRANSTSAVWLPSVGKHPGAVLLLNAQRPILLTFNESPPPPHPSRSSDARPFCFGVRLRARQVTPEDHSRGNHRDFSAVFPLRNSTGLCKRGTGRAAPEDPSTAVLLSSNVFVPASTTELLWLSSCLVHVTRYER